MFNFRVESEKFVRIGFGGRSGHGPTLRTKANEMQRIPAPFPDQNQYLFGPHPASGAEADAARLEMEGCLTEVITVTQGHADWYVSRFFRLSASIRATGHNCGR